MIIEIEEKDITPTKLCGKFLTLALSSYFIHESENSVAREMSDSVSFIQILNTGELKKTGAKPNQWKNLKKSITKALPIKGSKVGKYRLLYASV